MPRSPLLEEEAAAFSLATLNLRQMTPPARLRAVLDLPVRESN